MPQNNNTTVKTHISLNVSDIEKSIAFYEMFFGVPAHKRRPGYANFDIDQPALKLALQQGTVKPGAGTLSHLGIQVPDAALLQETRRRMEEGGMISLDEGDTVCCYARQDKVWATDPDGNGWEVYLLLDEMDDHADEHFTELQTNPIPHDLVAETTCCAGGTGATCC